MRHLLKQVGDYSHARGLYNQPNRDSKKSSSAYSAEQGRAFYTEAEVGYRKAIEDGLDYYGKCLDQAIEGQKKAREAIIELRRPKRWDDK